MTSHGCGTSVILAEEDLNRFFPVKSVGSHCGYLFRGLGGALTEESLHAHAHTHAHMALFKRSDNCRWLDLLVKGLWNRDQGPGKHTLPLVPSFPNLAASLRPLSRPHALSFQPAPEVPVICISLAIMLGDKRGRATTDERKPWWSVSPSLFILIWSIKANKWTFGWVNSCKMPLPVCLCECVCVCAVFWIQH